MHDPAERAALEAPAEPLEPMGPHGGAPAPGSSSGGPAPDARFGVRYAVESLGRAGRAALVVDCRPGRHSVILRIAGPDQWETADRVAAALNASRTETPVVQR